METDNLHSNERIVERFSPSNRYVWFMTVVGLVFVIIGGVAFWLGMQYIVVIAFKEMLAGLLAVVPAGLGIRLMVDAWWLDISHQYFITNQRVVETKGVLTRQTVSADLQNITDITINQDLFERMFLRTGTIIVNTAGGPHDEIMLIHVENPYDCKNKIRGLVSQLAVTDKGERIDASWHQNNSVDFREDK